MAMTDDDPSILAAALVANARLQEQLDAADLAPAPGNHATVFVRAVVGLSLLVVVSILTIFIVRPDRDNTPLIAVILGFVGPIIAAFLAASIQQVHLAVNSRLSQLLALTAKASRAEGQLSGQVAGAAAAVALKNGPGA